MKKFFSKFLILFFLLLGTSMTNAFSEPKIFTQGLYTVKDSQLSTGTSYYVRNTSSSNKSLLIIIDSNQMIQELIRLEPNSQKYTLKPLEYGEIIVVIGAANLEFS